MQSQRLAYSFFSRSQSCLIICIDISTGSPLADYFISPKEAHMNITGLLIALLIGAVAGFLAGQIMKGRGFGILGNIIVGILGALVFGFLFGNFNLLNSAILNEIAGGTIGAVILLFVISLIKKAT
jgi:uncharacterized membrane protein YeaQ/YmgE (transglycosylase-associated protein family)